MKRPIPPHERGAALLAVLLLVAVMGALTASALERLRLSTSLALNTAALDQARAYAIGVESLVALTIDDLIASSPERTTLDGGWHGKRRRFPMPGEAVAEATLRDGSNCFNINSVAEEASEGRLVARPAGVAQFQGLMQLLAVPEASAMRIAESAADWVDSDTSPSSQGAEDQQYARAEQGYRTGNTRFADASELRAVSGMTAEIYQRLRPWLCALPTTDLSPINVNTLVAEQAPLLSMLAPNQISLEAARAALAARPVGGWNSLSDFYAGSPLSGVNLPSEVQFQPQLRTRWFALELMVELQGAELYETALIDTRIAPARVAVRRWGSDD